MVVVDMQAGELEENEITHQQGYRRSIWRSVVVFSLATLPCGVGLLFIYWFPHVALKLIAAKCSMTRATHVLLKDCDGNWCVEKIRYYHADSECEADDNDDAYDDRQLSSTEEEMASILPNSTQQRIVYIEHRHLRYFYDQSSKVFVKLRGIHDDLTCLAIHELQHGLSMAEKERRMLCYGPNSIDVPVKPYYALFIDEVLHPFYIFQILSIMFWMIDVYYYYSGTVLFISTVSLVISLVQTKKQMKQLHNMVYHSSKVSVLRGSKVVDDLSSEDLVPGDVLVIPKNGMSMPCDAALLTGNCIVNEAMLTGESLPVTKTPLPQDANMKYSPDDCKRHTLYNGTEIIQTRVFGHADVLAVVIRTGFATAKGSLVRSILFPKPLDLKMLKDIMKFVIFLAILAALAFAYTITILRLHHYNNIEETILRAFDVITTVVPPALPAALTVGTVYSLSRLKKQDIYCISPQRVSLCGKIKLACFDKTGTLTEDTIDLLGVRPCYDQRFTPLVTEPHNNLPMNELKYAMGTCHSLTRIDGVLCGDPLELKMFESLKWEMEEPGEECSRFDSVVPVIIQAKSNDDIFPSLELGIMRQFTFLSELQRMSVLVKKSPSDDAKQIEVYVKGSPEKIYQLCKPETIPPDFFTVLSKYTKRGCRVLAVAHRCIQVKPHRIDKLNRDEVECDLTLLGLLIMQNKLKPETAPVIAVLHSANIRTVMVTGDNLHTAISVARDCCMIEEGHKVITLQATDNGYQGVSLEYNIVGEDVAYADEIKLSDSYKNDFHINLKDTEKDHLLSSVSVSPSFHLAIDGTSFELVMQHHRELADRLMVCGTVFARMAPEQKAELVRYLQTLGYGVAMCGDGANDCGALKAAHAGISLSETEASVASPFTSKIPNISCVPKVIREGRASLVTAFSVFKFMALYSLTEFITVAILYSIDSNLGDIQYLYIDLVLILAFAFVMGFSGPYPVLIKKRPLGTLAGLNVLLSLTVHLLLITATQLALWYYIKTRQWYEPLVPNDGDNIVCSENTLLFQCSIFQYITLAVILSTGPPYRKPLYTNYWFMLCLLILIPPCVFFVMAPGSWLTVHPIDMIQLKQHPSIWFRATILAFVALHFMLAYFLEVYIIQSAWMAQILRWVKCKTQPRNKYKHVLKEVHEDSTWPPVFPMPIT